jgi:ribosomal-protein-alanine N-acetyltransferase
MTPRMIDDVLAFHKKNKEFLRPWEAEKTDLFYTRSYHRFLCRFEREQLRDLKGIDFWIYETETNELIGKVSVFHITKGNYSNCMLGYKLGEEFQDHGYMHEALGEVIRFLFSELNLHRAEIDVLPRNTRSIHVAENLGFELEGTGKQLIEVNGVWEDHLRFAKINRQWKNQ